MLGGQPKCQVLCSEEVIVNVGKSDGNMATINHDYTTLTTGFGQN